MVLQFKSTLTAGIYRIPKRGQGEKQAFVQSVHQILNNLRSWGTTLPETLRLDYQNIPTGLKRPVATIHLAYNQVPHPSPYTYPS